MTKTGEDNSIELLCHSAITLIQQSREYILKQIHKTEAATYFLIGAWIVEVQQGGEERAKYGAKIVQNLSDALRYTKPVSLSALSVPLALDPKSHMRATPCFLAIGVMTLFSHLISVMPVSSIQLPARVCACT